MTLDEFVDFAGDDLLDVAVAGEGLAHERGIDIELDRRYAPGQHIALESRRDVQHEGVVAPVHAGVDLCQRDHDRCLETWRIKAGDDARGQGRTVLVDDGDGRIVQALRHGGGRHVDREGEGIGDQHQHDRITRQTPQLLHAQAEYILGPDHEITPPVF